jgi:hypothetical protein
MLFTGATGLPWDSEMNVAVITCGHRKIFMRCWLSFDRPACFATKVKRKKLPTSLGEKFAYRY